MMTDYPHAGPAPAIQELMDDIVLTGGRHCFPVGGGDQVIGLITLNEVRAVPHEEWATATVGKSIIPLNRLKSVTPDTGLFEVFEQMAQADANQNPVVDKGQLVGMVARDNILAFLQARANLGI